MSAAIKNLNVISPLNQFVVLRSCNNNPWIEILFVRSPTIFPLLQFTCPDLKGGTFTTTSAQANAISFSIPAFPQSIKFEAKKGEQTILKLGEEGGPIFLKFTVKQIKED